MVFLPSDQEIPASIYIYISLLISPIFYIDIFSIDLSHARHRWHIKDCLGNLVGQWLVNKPMARRPWCFGDGERWILKRR